MLDLSRYKRVHLGHFPTPIEFLPNLTKKLGGPNLYIKRDDCTGLATGGNKTRKLEFLVADALAQGADTLITQGAVQSNHARQTVAAAAKVGLQCKILLEQRVPDAPEDYRESGNVFLDRLMGGEIASYHPAGTDMNQAMDELAHALKADGRHPYVIPGGGSNEVGALGYVACAQEILSQTFSMGLQIDHVVHTTGSAGTQAGLVVGFAATNSGVPVYGIGNRLAKAPQEEKVWGLVQKLLEFLGVSQSAVDRSQVFANTDYVGKGYGQPVDATLDAIRLVAETEAILLDPVYTAKAMEGLIDLIKKGHFKKGENILFMHTGGVAGLFGYRHAFPG